MSPQHLVALTPWKHVESKNCFHTSRFRSQRSAWNLTGGTGPGGTGCNKTAFRGFSMYFALQKRNQKGPSLKLRTTAEPAQVTSIFWCTVHHYSKGRSLRRDGGSLFNTIWVFVKRYRPSVIDRVLLSIATSVPRGIRPEDGRDAATRATPVPRDAPGRCERPKGRTKQDVKQKKHEVFQTRNDKHSGA